MLHNDPELFEQFILKTAEDTGVEAGIIEKDYYVTLSRLCGILFQAVCFRSNRIFGRRI